MLRCAGNLKMTWQRRPFQVCSRTPCGKEKQVILKLHKVTRLGWICIRCVALGNLHDEQNHGYSVFQSRWIWLVRSSVLPYLVVPFTKRRFSLQRIGYPEPPPSAEPPEEAQTLDAERGFGSSEFWGFHFTEKTGGGNVLSLGCLVFHGIVGGENIWATSSHKICFLLYKRPKYIWDLWHVDVWELNPPQISAYQGQLSGWWWLRIKPHMCWSLNSHYFHIIGDKLINPIVGVQGFPIKGGMTIPNRRSLDPGTYDLPLVGYDCTLKNRSRVYFLADT